MVRNAVAIFYKATGTMTEFNPSDMLYLNMRYHALYDEDDSKRHAFWFTMMAHELARQVRSGHPCEHFFLSEFYVATNILKLSIKLRDVVLLHSRLPAYINKFVKHQPRDTADAC